MPICVERSVSSMREMTEWSNVPNYVVQHYSGKDNEPNGISDQSQLGENTRENGKRRLCTTDDQLDSTWREGRRTIDMDVEMNNRKCSNLTTSRSINSRYSPRLTTHPNENGMTIPAVPTARETLRFFRNKAKSILVALVRIDAVRWRREGLTRDRRERERARDPAR